ncbi:hypothetical protein EIP86_011103 [Pleurotus ostreatoroseus]|nr:hypothetical protein EIP86_006244 [Pleurotus ostreatoroseus]KAF7799861.1 hypothetical protein EIP86_011103 [Pleurotus ostreatoroseus]
MPPPFGQVELEPSPGRGFPTTLGCPPARFGCRAHCSALCASSCPTCAYDLPCGRFGGSGIFARRRDRGLGFGARPPRSQPFRMQRGGRSAVWGRTAPRSLRLRKTGGLTCPHPRERFDEHASACALCAGLGTIAYPAAGGA